MARKIAVEIVGDSRQLERAFKRSAKSAQGFSREIGRFGRGGLAGTGVFQSLGRSVAFASSAFLGAFGLTAAVRGAFEEMSQAQQATAQTNAALRSTGGVANVTAKQIDTLATSLMNMSGIDDELIKGSENLLLTFTNVRDFAGEGNQIFTRASKAALDLSVRFKQDLASSAIQLGKALNDPIRGITALRRIGVSFSDAQVKLIKRLVETGRTLDAQKIILREVGVETGGAAKALGETLGGQFNIFTQNLRNLGGTIAQELNPALETLVKRANHWIQNTENQRRVVQAFRDVGGAVQTVAGFLQGVVDKLGGVKNTIRDAGLVWVGFKAAGVGAAAAVSIANVGAAATVKAAWRAALISTGFGALAVAAGIAAEYVITHWEKVKGWFQEFWEWLRINADKAALAVIEPFSHLPSKAGKWARDLKTSIQKDLGDLRDKTDDGARAVGKAFSDGLEKGAKAKPSTKRTLPQYVPGPTVKDAKDAAKKHADAVEKAREEARKRAEAAQRRREALSTRLFGVLGFGPGGEQKTPSLRQLRAQLNAMRGSLAGAPPRIKRQVDRIRKALSENIVPTDVRARIREMLNGIRDELKKGVDGGTPRGFTYTGHPGVGGRSLAFAGAGAFGGVHIAGNVNVYNTHNIGDLEHQLTKRQAGRAHNRRGAR